MLLRKGLISYRSLEESVRAIKAGKRQGTLLVESGAIRSKDLVDGVTEQVQEIIYSVFQWDDGAFDFQEGDLPSREVIVLRMSTADLIMEGVRRVERWTRIRRAVGGLGQQYRLAADTASTMGDMSLHKEEMDLIATVDGVMSLEEICAAARQSDFKVCRTCGACGRRASSTACPGLRPRAQRQDGAPRRAHARGGGGPEIEGFNELHRFLFELVSYELRERAPDFFERAFSRALQEEASLFEGVSVDAAGELDSFALPAQHRERRDRALPGRPGPPARDRGGAGPRAAGRAQGRDHQRRAHGPQGAPAPARGQAELTPAALRAA